MSHLSSVIDDQLRSLDDTDGYASVWADALERAAENPSKLQFGGRGAGGRGFSRRTWQTQNVVVERVRLEYVGDRNLPSTLLLDEATIKLLQGRIYSLVGRNGSGKSTLLRRIHAGKIPGFPPFLSTLYLPQEVTYSGSNTPVDEVVSRVQSHCQQSSSSLQDQIDQLEQIDLSTEDVQRQERIEEICQQIDELQDELETGRNLEILRKQSQQALKAFGLKESLWNTPASSLSVGQRKKVQLSSALLCHCDLLLLDEPTNHLDVAGLLDLRRFVSDVARRNTTVLFVSHDLDFINDLATDVIHLWEKKLIYYPGNYRDFEGYRLQKDLHRLRQDRALEKKRDSMISTLENLKKQAIPRRGGFKKKTKAIESQRKKMERLGLEKDGQIEQGH